MKLSATLALWAFTFESSFHACDLVMVGGGVALGRYAGSWAVFREGNVEQMAPKWLFIPLANSSAVFFSCPGMDILPFFLSMPAICLMVVNHDPGENRENNACQLKLNRRLYKITLFSIFWSADISDFSTLLHIQKAGSSYFTSKNIGPTDFGRTACICAYLICANVGILNSSLILGPTECASWSYNLPFIT